MSVEHRSDLTLASDEDRGSGAERRRSGVTGRRTSWVVVGLPAAVALVLSVAWSSRPSYWLDETATVSAVDRPFPDLLRLLHNVDAVHGVYYVAIWPWARLGTGEAWMRLPSAFAAGGAAAAVAAIGWQLLGHRAGLVAGLVYATLPLVSYDGANARSPAIQSMLVAAATFFLIRAVRSRRTRWSVAYSLTMAAAVAVFLFTAPVLAAHALYLLTVRRARLLWATALPVVAAVVVAGVTRRQDGQVSWIRRPAIGDLPGILSRAWFSWSWVLTAVAGTLTVLGLVVLVLRRGRSMSGSAVLLGGVLVIPTAMLWSVSQVHPVLDDRYVPTGAIAVAVLVAAGIAALPGRRVVVPALVGVVVLAGLPSQLAQRQPAGRGDDYRDDPRGAMRLIGRDARLGDAVSFPDGYARGAAIAYPDLVAGVPDISLGAPRVPTATLYGYGVSIDTFARRLGPVDRVWLVTFPITRPVTQDAERSVLSEQGFRVISTHFFGRTSVTLWARDRG